MRVKDAGDVVLAETGENLHTTRNNFNLNSDNAASPKGPSIFDIRHNVTVNAVYELPFGPGKSFLSSPGAIGKILGGWLGTQVC